MSTGTIILDEFLDYNADGISHGNITFELKLEITFVFYMKVNAMCLFL